MTDLHNSLKKYTTKLGKAISELQIIEKELHVILHQKLVVDDVIGTEDLTSDNLITEDPKDEIIKEADEKDKEDLDSAVEVLEKMLDDNELWSRRKEEHKKIVEYEENDSQNSELNNNQSDRPNNITSLEESTPDPNLIKPDMVEKKSPPINALSRLSPEYRSEILFKIYKDAVKTVKSVVGDSYDEKEHQEMVLAESDKLLEIWMKSN